MYSHEQCTCIEQNIQIVPIEWKITRKLDQQCSGTTVVCKLGTFSLSNPVLGVSRNVLTWNLEVYTFFFEYFLIENETADLNLSISIEIHNEWNLLFFELVCPNLL